MSKNIIGLVMPDRGDRPEFFERAQQYIKRQSWKPDQVEIVNEDLGIEGIDLVYRYELGFKRLFEKDCTVVVCMESDDWYHPDCIKTLCQEWEKADRPAMLGIDSSIYYNIMDQRYYKFGHPGRASMNSMLVTSEVLKHKYNYKDPYLDFRLWQSIGGKTFHAATDLVIGIKHGQGMVAGSGHKLNWEKYLNQDRSFINLEGQIGKVDAGFYKVMAQRSNYTISKTSEVLVNPFLSILTRVHGERRPNGFAANKASVASLTSRSYEHIFIHDKIGLGRYYANMAFTLACAAIEGEFVFMLDDDDFIVNDRMIEELQQIVKVKPETDVIVFRNIIKNGTFNNYYPSPECWASQVPKIAHIGGSCFVCRAEVYKEFVGHFGRPACGDYYMLEAMFKSGKLNWYWHDSLMMETGRVSHGKVEGQI